MTTEPMIERVTLIERDVPAKRERWSGIVNGRPVTADVSMDDYSRVWGRVFYRDFVVAALLNEAGA